MVEIARKLSLAKRYDTNLSLLFFDLDNFKRVNDTFGHLAGNLVIKQVARILLSSAHGGFRKPGTHGAMVPIVDKEGGN
ncbi:MAG: diguanylate cyclase [bacterium]